jgi:hypothetical protein
MFQRTPKWVVFAIICLGIAGSALNIVLAEQAECRAAGQASAWDWGAFKIRCLVKAKAP